MRGRSIVVKKLKPLPIEAVVRGYLDRLGLEGLPEDRQRSAASSCPRACSRRRSCPQPIFTPATKAEAGHDENISFERGREADRQGAGAQKVRDISIRLYKEAAEYAATKGIIIADTKFEFGLDAKGNLVLIDEVLTADSSRFWPADSYQVGMQPALVRQAVRARLSRDARLGQDAAGAQAARPT